MRRALVVALWFSGATIFAAPMPSNEEIDHAFLTFLDVKESILHRCIYRPTEMDILRGAQKELAKELGPEFSRTFKPLAGNNFKPAWKTFQQTLIKLASAPKSKLSLQELVEHSLRGYCASLDRYSEYDDLASWEQLKKLKLPAYSGVGMTLMRTKTGYECYPFPGAPADQAGADPGDQLLEVEGQDVRGRPIGEVGAMFVGKVGEKVQFKVQHRRGDKVEVLSASREKLRSSPIEVERRDGGATVRLRQLNDATVKDLRDFLRTIGDGAPLTLDLRGCSGGELKASIEVARLFLSKDAVIAQVETLHGKEVYTSDNETPYRSSKLIILQDRGTMSGAELITVALVTSVHAESRGEKSFGKGATISEEEVANGHGRLLITESRMYGPNHETWEGEGLPPKVETEPAQK